MKTDGSAKLLNDGQYRPLTMLGRDGAVHAPERGYAPGIISQTAERVLVFR
jgi:hypothetical protein